jgi:hypothetical protein
MHDDSDVDKILITTTTTTTTHNNNNNNKFNDYNNSIYSFTLSDQLYNFNVTNIYKNPVHVSTLLVSIKWYIVRK